MKLQKPSHQLINNSNTATSQEKRSLWLESLFSRRIKSISVLWKQPVTSKTS